MLWGKVAPDPDRHIEGRLWADHRRVADPPGAGRRKPSKSPGDEEAVPCLIKSKTGQG